MHLAWKMWRQTSHAVGGCIPTGRGHPHRTLYRQLAAIQRTRWLTEVGWQLMAQAFKWPGRVGGSVSTMHAPCVGQTDDAIYGITIARHHTLTHSAIHIACLAYISQLINQAKHISIAPYVTSESDAALHRDHQHITCHDCLLLTRSSVNSRL